MALMRLLSPLALRSYFNDFITFLALCVRLRCICVKGTRGL